ncbi:hypothetical protein STEG23_017019, partial [Scotinomys teguina]
MSGSSGGATAPAASSGPAAAASAAGSGCGGGAGEGTEEAAKDLADIAAFFRSDLDTSFMYCFDSEPFEIIPSLVSREEMEFKGAFIAKGHEA